MKLKLLWLFLLLIMVIGSGGIFPSNFTFGQSITDSQKEFVREVYYPATFILYAKDKSGELDGECTATIIDKTDKGYDIETASHCVCTESKDEVHPVKGEEYFISDNSKDFLKASLKGCGSCHRGDDFAILNVSTGDTFPVVPLGTDPIVMEQVVNVANPLSLGKQVFLGSVSSPSTDRPLLAPSSRYEDEINWSNVILLQMFGVNHGSSGSSIVCINQNAICGFVVGIYGGFSNNVTTSIALPVSRFIEFRKELAEGKYKYWNPKVESK